MNLNDLRAHRELALKQKSFNFTQLVFKNNGKEVINDNELKDMVQSIDYVYARGNPNVYQEDKRDVLKFLALKSKKNRQRIQEYIEEHDFVQKHEKAERNYKKIVQ